MIDIENFQAEYDEARARTAADHRAVRPEKETVPLAIRVMTLPVRTFLMQTLPIR